MTETRTMDSAQVEHVHHPRRAHRLDEMPAVRFASLVARVVLGIVMLVAGVEKLTALDQFAVSIYHYQMFPLSVTNVLALLFVWSEITVGVLLLVGAAVRGAALISGLLLIAFIVAVGWAMANGLKIDCGCFVSAKDARAAQGTTISPIPPQPLPVPMSQDSIAAYHDTSARHMDSTGSASAGGEQVGWPKIFEDVGLLALAVFLTWYPKSYLTADESLRKEGREEG